MKYEVRSYNTVDDFDQRQPTRIAENMTALSAAWLAINETQTNAIVKVQSEDREEIWIIKAHD